MIHSPFSNSTYIKLFLAQVISLIGTGVTTIALALLAWELAKDEAGQVLGIALSLKMLAYVFFTPIITAYVYKLPRRIWLVILDIIRATIVLYLPFVTQVWEIYLLLFLINLCSSGFTPVYQATISDIIKDELAYKKALSYSRLAYDLEQLLSPSFAAVLLLFISFSTIFILNSITFIISAILIFICTIPNIKRIPLQTTIKERVFFGVSAYLKTPRLKALFFLYMSVSLASAMMITNTVVYVGEYLQRTESSVAIAMAFSGFGSMLVALILPKFLNKIQLRIIVLFGSLILIIGLFLASFNLSWQYFLILWFILGVGLSLIQVPAGLLIRISCKEEDSINYFSANFSLSHLCWMFSYIIAGVLGVKFGLENTFLLFSFLALISTLIAYKIYPNPDELEIEHTHEEITHSHNFINDKHHNKKNFSEKTNEHIHKKVTHTHKYVIDYHHKEWPV